MLDAPILTKIEKPPVESWAKSPTFAKTPKPCGSRTKPVRFAPAVCAGRVGAGVAAMAGGEPLLTGCVVDGNRATSGAGIYVIDGEADVVSTAFLGNRARYENPNYGKASGVGGATLLALYFVPSLYLMLMCNGRRGLAETSVR